MRITNIRKTGQAEKVLIKCPECGYKNRHFVSKETKLNYSGIMWCRECGAVLAFDVEVESAVS